MASVEWNSLIWIFGKVKPINTPQEESVNNSQRLVEEEGLRSWVGMRWTNFVGERAHLFGSTTSEENAKAYFHYRKLYKIETIPTKI